MKTKQIILLIYSILSIQIGILVSLYGGHVLCHVAALFMLISGAKILLDVELCKLKRERFQVSKVNLAHYKAVCILDTLEGSIILHMNSHNDFGYNENVAEWVVNSMNNSLFSPPQNIVPLNNGKKLKKHRP